MPLMLPSSQPSGYLNDLLAQPRALRDTLDGLKKQSLPSTITAQLRDFDTILLTGMGASISACYPLHQALVRRGLPAQMIETSELLYFYDALLRPGTLLVTVSQSGRSPEILTLLERKSAGFTVLGVTNTPGSPLAARADAVVLTQAGEEFTVSCKTYVTALAALAWLEPVLTGEAAEGVLADLEAAVPAVEAYLADWQQHVEELQQRMSETRTFFVVGRGPSLAAAHTGGLIVKESTHLHGEGMSSAAFRHGPLEMLAPDVFVLVFEGEKATAGGAAAAGFNRRLYEDVKKAGAGAGWVSEQAAAGVFRLPAAAEPARPILEILPVQMITLALSALRGHEAGRFTRATKVTQSE